MPDLDTSLHLDMLRRFKKETSLTTRIFRALRRGPSSKTMYGLEWGDPEMVAPLKFMKERYVLPYVNAQHTVVEIGPGGGRWTQYLLGFKSIIVVDFYAEMLDQLKININKPHIRYVKNNGTDFPGIEKDSIDYLFSFGTFVHLDVHLIEAYLKNMREIIRPAANVVIQYSDKTKIMAQQEQSFSDNTPENMRRLVTEAGYTILEEDVTTLWHSSIIRFTK